VSTAYRYIREGIAALAPTLGEAIAVAAGTAYVALDGSLLRIDRVAMASHRDRPYYSGKHKAHGVNVQVVTDSAGRLIWVSPALPGSRHDIATAREHGVLDAFDAAGVKALADTGYQGAGPAVRVRTGGWATTVPAVSSVAARCRLGRRPSTALTPLCGHPVNAPTPS
jgi:hypothetical protein